MAVALSLSCRRVVVCSVVAVIEGRDPEVDARYKDKDSAAQSAQLSEERRGLLPVSVSVSFSSLVPSAGLMEDGGYQYCTVLCTMYGTLVQYTGTIVSGQQKAQARRGSRLLYPAVESGRGNCKASYRGRYPRRMAVPMALGVVVVVLFDGDVRLVED